MKILIVSSKLNPPFQTPRAFRTAELARELGRREHNVTVYVEETGYDYKEFEEKNNLKIKTYKKLSWPKIIIPRNNKITNIINRVFGTIMINFFRYPEIEYYFKVKETLKNETDYDLMISIASPHPIHWGCTSAILKNPELAKKWIADCGDPFMGDKTNPYPRPFYFKYIEKWFCKNVDIITVPIEGAIKGYFKEFHSKIGVIPQGFDLNGIKTFQKVSKNKVTTFAYAGYLMKKIRDPKPLLSYLISKKYKFKFIIYSEPIKIVIELIRLFPDYIELRRPIKRDLLIYELGKMDFLINFDNGTDIQMPSKLIDYSLAGPPVLNIFPGEIKNPEIIDEFFNENYQNKMNLPENSHYDIKIVAEKFLSLG